MKFITQNKTNWKFLWIVFVLGIVVGGGILFFSQFYSWNLAPKFFSTKEQCELETKCECGPSWCDYAPCPINSKKGWACRQPKATETPLSTILSTAGWQTYRNEELGFEIKYPKDWDLYTSSHLIHFDSFAGGTHPTLQDSSIWIRGFVGYSSLDDWRQQSETLENANGFSFELFEETIPIGIERGYKLVENNSEMPTEIVVYKDGKIIGFSQLLPVSCHDADCTLFNQMLSTFRFVE